MPPPEITGKMRKMLGKVVCDEIIAAGITNVELNMMLNDTRFRMNVWHITKKMVEEYRSISSLAKRPPFVTIEVGIYETIADLEQAMADQGVLVRRCEHDMMSRPEFKLLEEPAELEMYKIAIEEFGSDYFHGCSIVEASDMLKRIGAVVLPPEAAAQFCLQHKRKQPKGPWFMYMDAIDSAFGLRIFGEEDETSELRLMSRDATPNDVLHRSEVILYGRNNNTPRRL